MGQALLLSDAGVQPKRRQSGHTLVTKARNGHRSPIRGAIPEQVPSGATGTKGAQRDGAWSPSPLQPES